MLEKRTNPQLRTDISDNSVWDSIYSFYSQFHTLTYCISLNSRYAEMISNMPAFNSLSVENIKLLFGDYRAKYSFASAVCSTLDDFKGMSLEEAKIRFGSTITGTYHSFLLKYYLPEILNEKTSFIRAVSANQNANVIRMAHNPLWLNFKLVFNMENTFASNINHMIADEAKRISNEETDEF